MKTDMIFLGIRIFYFEKEMWKFKYIERGESQH